MMGSMEQEQYYIATEDGKTEGPYSFESLETFYAEGKINDDTLVCIAGGQEWVQFWTILEQERKKEVQPCEEPKKQALERLMNEYDPIPEDQPAKKSQEEAKPLEITVEGLFRVFGVIALLAGVIVFMYHAQEQTGIGLAYLLAGAFSCLGCFWCAKVSGLLSRAVDLLSVIAKRVYNSGNSTDKQ
ncbi:hypothetical protein CXU19_11205 [Akkermansia muciniphila]|nr:hypothetical protein CXU19_11205 [Akkermansia muciniphila]PNC37697.1 hypothetical protein CXU20_11390 [Akkermansia muciniphila]